MRTIIAISLMLATPVLAQTPPPAAAKPNTVTGKPPADDPYWQQTVCRKDVETGSLVKVRKTCHTRAQWAYIDDTNRDFSQRLMDDNRTKSTSN
jgi:hypothetical protein